MSDHIQSAITAATDAEFADFKSAIISALSDKVADQLEIQKMELAGSIFDDESYEEPQDSQEFTTDQEENVDEEF